MLLAATIILGQAAATLLLSWYCFGHVRVTRPPLGVFNLTDIAIMLGAIVLVPMLYLLLPLWLVAGLLGLGAFSSIYLIWEAVLPVRWATWLVSLVLVGADVAATFFWGAGSLPFFLVNNLVLMLVVVGTTNLWAQAGMKARDATVLGAALIVYDFLATSQLPMMTDLIQRLTGLPFSPMVAFPLGDGTWVGIGLGDLLLAAVFPLVMRKAFGRRAGLGAMGIALAEIGGLLLVASLSALDWVFPVMVLLGPSMVLQYLYWRRRQGAERTTWEYLQLAGLPA